MEIEISQLELRYARLRIRDAGQRARLLASLARDGQQSALSVVALEGEPDRFVLIDGYARVSALRELARDVVRVTVLPTSEAEALVISHGLDGQRRQSALEEGWLLEVLMEHHGLTLGELATRLGRSRSWVSRRLALVTVLPTAVQERVRQGRLGAQVATKYLVPLARANALDCELLVANLEGETPTVRGMHRLYAAYKGGTTEQRRRIVASPLLFLKATEDDTGAMSEAAAKLLADLRMVAAVSRRTERRIDEGGYRDAALAERARLRVAWSATMRSFASLRASASEWETSDAGPGHSSGDPAPSD